ncbi:serine hydrolase FSH [Chaetomium fimeti]|uniref:Serine hydrolase FSH n=1 Tax=Chaetomium fimeti TaxID=1854472 RepID=A0AAE0H5F9_9PEZI|nr:serine hydrolase FSH [Chaetomium fimeti]
MDARPVTNAPTIPKDTPKKKFRILMLHGYTQSGQLFALKTAALYKAFAKAFKPLGLEVVLIYPTGPISIDPSLEQYAWYRKNDHTGEYEGLDKGMDHIAEVFREARRETREEEGNEDGGVDCVLGFSQGASMAAMLAAALESGRKPPAAAEPKHQGWLDNVREANGHRPLKLAVLYGGFVAAPPELEWLYNPEIVTPTFHVIGSLDTIVVEEISRKLAAKCKDAQTMMHPGGHYVPVGKWFMPVLQFILTVGSPKATL